MAIEAKVLADSVDPWGVRLTTLQIRFPRFLLAELNTHRMLSRNSASSRAIPVSKQASNVLADPFVPERWGANQRGMQAGAPIVGWRATAATLVWRALVLGSVLGAKALARLGVHKQWANRPLEPYAWQTAIVTATEWANFFALRNHPDAQPEFHALAATMQRAIRESRYKYLEEGEWHLPLVPDFEELRGKYLTSEIARISCARCARVSVLTHDGKRDPEADLGLAAKLQGDGHMSPFEHAAVVGSREGQRKRPSNFRGLWVQYRKLIPNEHNFALVRTT